MLESWGPLHQVRLEFSGETVEARQHTTVEYDKGAPTPKEGETWPNLPTKETTAAVVPGQESELEPRVTRTAYNWAFRKPTEEIVDPNGLDLISKTVYYTSGPNEGQVKEERQPSRPDGGNASTTKTEYYVPEKNINNPCASVAWAGLPCKSKPAAAPSPAGSRPELQTTKFARYSNLDRPEEIQEYTWGWLKRDTAITYDSAGRLVRTRTFGEGIGVPAVETTYSSTTGAPVSHQLVCETQEECNEGVEPQTVTTTYDGLGRPIEYEDADGNKSGVSYDLLGRPVASTDGKGTQEVTYDGASGVATELTDSAAGTFKATYNADGQMTEQLLPDGLAQKIGYDPAGTAVSLAYEKQNFCSTGCTWLSFNREDSVGGQVLREEAPSATTNTPTTRQGASPWPRNTAPEASARPAPTASTKTPTGSPRRPERRKKTAPATSNRQAKNRAMNTTPPIA